MAARVNLNSPPICPPSPPPPVRPGFAAWRRPTWRRAPAACKSGSTTHCERYGPLIEQQTNVPCEAVAAIAIRGPPLPLRAAQVTPQQACVFYSGEVCLGGALIATPGRSLYEQEHDAPTAGVQSLASA